MYDPSYPYSNNHVEETQPPPPSGKLRIDKSYFKTMPAILKFVELICNLVGFICIKISWTWVSAIFYNILYWVGIIITSVLFLAYLFHFVEKFDSWPWLKIEMYYCGIMVLAYIGTSIFATVLGESVGYAVGFFGLCAIISYGLDGFLKYKLLKRGLPPQ